MGFGPGTAGVRHSHAEQRTAEAGEGNPPVRQPVCVRRWQRLAVEGGLYSDPMHDHRNRSEPLAAIIALLPILEIV